MRNRGPKGGFARPEIGPIVALGAVRKLSTVMGKSGGVGCDSGPVIKKNLRDETGAGSSTNSVERQPPAR
jgi:hypothetical protein